MNSELISDNGSIEPFWLRIPRFFSYPAQSSVLIVMAGFSLLQLLANLPAIGWVVSLLLWLAAYKYSYEVLVHTAEGNLDPPESRNMAGTDSIGIQQFFLMLGMILLVWGVLWFTQSLFLAGMLALFFLVSFPAAIITLAMTQSLASSLNPLIWVSLMHRIGFPYLLVVLFLFLMVISMFTLEAFITPASPVAQLFMGPVFYFVEFYFMVAMFHLMGYMIYQYHEVLGVEVNGPEERSSVRAASPDAQLIAETQALVQDGKLPDAIEKVGRTIRGQGGTRELHEHYRKLLRLKGDKAGQLNHARQYLPVLLEALDQPYQAVDLVAECYQCDPAFALSNPKYIGTLAEHAELKGRHSLAIQLTNGFAKRFPSHPDIPRNYFLVAKILTDHMGEDKKALGILRSLLKKYPDHPLQPEISHYVRTLESIGAG
ncbi:MAG: hypothetical protein GY703_18905 [Gammaproteobacteria bacterium]|nr:hypothetical protein [Gammaproteobacteria bacterium]